eukprot:sb/3468248/
MAQKCGCSDPDLVPSYLVTPRFSDRINFPRYRKVTVFDPDLVPTPIYMSEADSKRVKLEDSCAHANNNNSNDNDHELEDLNLLDNRELMMRILKSQRQQEAATLKLQGSLLELRKKMNERFSAVSTKLERVDRNIRGLHTGGIGGVMPDVKYEPGMPVVGPDTTWIDDPDPERRDMREALRATTTYNEFLKEGLKRRFTEEELATKKLWGDPRYLPKMARQERDKDHHSQYLDKAYIENLREMLTNMNRPNQEITVSNWLITSHVT